MAESSRRKHGDHISDNTSPSHRLASVSSASIASGSSGLGQDDSHGTAPSSVSKQGAGAGSSSGSRVRFVEANSYSNAKDQIKQKRKDAQTYKRISAFLQGTVGIDLASSNPNHLPVIVSDLAWTDLRSLSTALGMGSPASAQEILAREKASTKRALRLVISELRQRSGAGGALADVPSSSSLSSNVASSSFGSTQQLSGTVPDSHLLYAMLYSAVDDRYEMVSYSMHTLTGIHLQ
jgi:hypothetical protein